MTKPWMGQPRDDWQIEIAYAVGFGVIAHANASLWKFYSPGTGACFGSLATGGGVGVTIGVEFDIDGVDLSNRTASAGGAGLNSSLVIHRPFRPIDIRRAYMNELSFGLAALLEISATDFSVYSHRDTELFSFSGADLGGTLGAKVSLLNYTRLVFNPPFELPESRWDALVRRGTNPVTRPR